MGSQLKILGRSETIELPILNNKVREYKFGDSETVLDKVLVHGVCIHTADLVKSPQSRTMLPDAELKQGFITLADGKNQKYNANLPIETFFKNQNFILFFKPRMISVRASSILLPNAANLVIPADAYAIVVTLFYEEFDATKHNVNGIGELVEED
ncbi:MAG: hypothetical protein ACOYKE_02450 [Ferruginibacter sp.]